MQELHRGSEMVASKISSTVMAVVIIAGLFQSVSAVTHTVTWTYGANATQFDELASKQTFQVADIIQFNYDSSHNVFEVSKADLDSCNLNNPIVKYETVGANVTLARSGYFGFICGVPGHCGNGNMKMNVQVLAANSSSPPSATPSPAPSPSPPVTPPTSSPGPGPVSPPTAAPLPSTPISPPTASPPPSISPSPSDASSLQSRAVMIVGALVAGCAAAFV